MRFNSIRSRMLVAALVPVLLVVLTVVGAFWFTRSNDLDAAHRQRSTLLVRQVAMASEYGLFSGNASSLQHMVSAVLREPDVRWVGVFDLAGTLVAYSGTGTGPMPELSVLRNRAGALLGSSQKSDSLVELVVANTVPLDDLYSAPASAQGELVQAPVLGYAVIEVSRESLTEREHELLLAAIAVGIVGLLLGSLLAARLGERVVQPVLDVSRRIDRIGQGDLDGRRAERGFGPLEELQRGLDHMAIQLAWGRDELEQRVEQVTHELRLKKEEAETATLAKSRFLAAASHDLRQPTHALGLFVARLGQLPLDAQPRYLVERLDAAVQSMQNLLDGLLDLSRLESGTVQARVRAFALVDVFDAVRDSTTPLAVEKGLRLQVRGSAVWVQSDPALLQRMVLNLVNNAVRYTPHGTVLVCCRRVDAGRNVRVDVLDSGIGISQEHLSEIFREFFQVGNLGRDRAQGLGLGLNIVERSAQLLGHAVAVRSGVGCGTRFSITLPIASPVPQLTPVSAAVPSLSATDGLHVLVLEDDDFSREAMRELLESWGCVVSSASTLTQAHVVVQKDSHPVDLILSDYRLGGGDDGISAIARLREASERKIPACLMSGNTDGELMQAAKDAGLSLLHKPVRPAKLRSLLRNLALPTPN